MKKLLFILAALILTWGCNTKPAVETDADLEKALTVAQISDNMAAWEDSVVIIKGTVDHVCKHGGKRIVIMDPDSTRIHIEAGDEISTYDATLINSEVLIWAKVKWEKIDEAYLADWESRIAQQESEAIAAMDTIADKESVSMEHFVEARAEIAETRAKVAASAEGFIKDFYLEGFKVRELIPASDDDAIGDDDDDDDDEHGDMDDSDEGEDEDGDDD